MNIESIKQLGEIVSGISEMDYVIGVNYDANIHVQEEFFEHNNITPNCLNERDDIKYPFEVSVMIGKTKIFVIMNQDDLDAHFPYLKEGEQDAAV
jgi:hypothetical protein